MTSYETIDKGHGRIEKRTYYLSSDLSEDEGKPVPMTLISSLLPLT